jgi:H+-transporting ATPase
MIYLKVSLSDFLTLFSARTEGPFWSIRPSNLLLGAATLALSLSTVLACVWPEGDLHEVPVEGLALEGGDGYTLWPLWVWIYCVFWWWVQDAFKVATYWLVLKFDIFQVGAASTQYELLPTHRLWCPCDELAAPPSS